MKAAGKWLTTLVALAAVGFFAVPPLILAAPPEPTMGGEDMAVYFERAPGCFVFVGSANPERGLDQPHHSPTFDFDEAALAIGCEFLLQAAQEALNR